MSEQAHTHTLTGVIDKRIDLLPVFTSSSRSYIAITLNSITPKKNTNIKNAITLTESDNANFKKLNNTHSLSLSWARMSAHVRSRTIKLKSKFIIFIKNTKSSGNSSRNTLLKHIL